jgi:hypothetical protein
VLLSQFGLVVAQAYDPQYLEAVLQYLHSDHHQVLPPQPPDEYYYSHNLDALGSEDWEVLASGSEDWEVLLHFLHFFLIPPHQHLHSLEETQANAPPLPSLEQL